MKKVTVKVCLGATCYVLGRKNLQELYKIVPEKFGDEVEVESSPCLGLCSIKWADSKAPYVKVNDEIIEEADVDKVIAAISKCMSR